MARRPNQTVISGLALMGREYRVRRAELQQRAGEKDGTDRATVMRQLESMDAAAKWIEQQQGGEVACE